MKINYSYALAPFKALLKVIRLNAKTKIGVSLLIAFIIIAILEPAINNYRLNGKNPMSIGVFPRLIHACPEAPLGSGPYGRDLFGLLLMGTRYTLSIGFTAAVIEIIIAITIGFLAGYKGGILDHLLRSVTDVMLVIPTWPILVVISAYTRRIDLLGMSSLIAVLDWPGLTRAIRSQVLSLKERPYIELAKVSGVRDLEIIFSEILPNMLPYVGVGFANAALGAMFAETGLRFMGVGPATIPTLGWLVDFTISSGFLTSRQYALIMPILFLILIFISLNLINVGLDEEYNPRLKKVTGL